MKICLVDYAKEAGLLYMYQSLYTQHHHNHGHHQQNVGWTIPTLIIIMVTIMVIIIVTRPKPAYGRQGLAGSWGQDTDEVSTFLVFLTSHFAPAALSSELNQPGTIHDDTNPPGIMKTRPGAITKT